MPGASTLPGMPYLRTSRRGSAAAAATIAGLAAVAVPAVAAPAPHPGWPRPEPAPAATLELIGRWVGDAAEIAAYDAGSRRLFVTDAAGAAVQVVDVRHPAHPVSVRDVDLSAYGAAVTSVAASGGLVAAVVAGATPVERGRLVLLDTDGQVDASVAVGFGPDMVTFTPDGRYLLVANEGEPQGYSPGDVDPVGSVTIVEVPHRAEELGAADVAEATFTAWTEEDLHPEVRISGPGASIPQDLEPEYVAVSRDSRTAYVTLQENNAVAVIDVRAARVRDIQPLGYSDHSRAGFGIDASDRDGGIDIRPRRGVLGMYLPDAIAEYEVRGRTYYVTANEGDGREYGDYVDEARVADLDPASLPAGLGPDVQDEAELGRLTVTTVDPWMPGGPLYAYGTRSFSIRSADGELMHDSGDAFERITAEVVPNLFNSELGDPAEFDQRSDNKGPEPEGIAVGRFHGRQLAFVGLERVGGVMVYDVTDPRSPSFLHYEPNRQDLAPEGILFVDGDASPTGRPLLVMTAEESGSVALYEVRRR